MKMLPRLLNNPLKTTAAGRCRYCRCTEMMACEEGCAWVDFQNTVCDSPDCVRKWAGALVKLMNLRARRDAHKY